MRIPVVLTTLLLVAVGCLQPFEIEVVGYGRSQALPEHPPLGYPVRMYRGPWITVYIATDFDLSAAQRSYRVWFHATLEDRVALDRGLRNPWVWIGRPYVADESDFVVSRLRSTGLKEGVYVLYIPVDGGELEDAFNGRHKPGLPEVLEAYGPMALSVDVSCYRGIFDGYQSESAPTMVVVRDRAAVLPFTLEELPVVTKAGLRTVEKTRDPAPSPRARHLPADES